MQFPLFFLCKNNKKYTKLFKNRTMLRIRLFDILNITKCNDTTGRRWIDMGKTDEISSPGKRLERLCEIEGISRSEFARRLNVAPSQISRILSGETKSISSDLLIRAAREFQVSTDYILGIEPLDKEKESTEMEPSENTGETEKIHIPMLLMSTAFQPGQCLAMIEQLQNADVKKMAYCEYYYFTGQHDKAVDLTELYLNHSDPMLRLSACLIHTFANLSLNHINAAKGGLESLKVNLRQVLSEETDRKTMAMGIFVAVAASTLLHLPMGEIPPLSEYLNELPKGMRLWGSYVLAHKAYLEQEYEKALGIVETSKMLSTEIYPIAFIYLNLMGAMACMNLRKSEMAKAYFMEAWQMAKPDGLIEGIGEHHGLLQGLIETCLKTDEPEGYKKVIQITYQFSYGWRRIHNPETKEDIADNLTTTEFTIAMLANRGWTNAEIAEHMNMTLRTVKQHLSSVFHKLNIDNRGQLKAYMLK